MQVRSVTHDMREEFLMNNLIKEIENADSIVITGHIKPDGDCVGSTLGMYNYITRNYPEGSGISSGVPGCIYVFKRCGQGKA